jgi:HK97 gp10 family phage protein
MSGINGMKDLLVKLNSLTGNTDAALFGIMENCGKFVEDDAKMNVPVDTHDLERSIQHETKKEKGVVRSIVYTNSDHAAFVEFGTGQAGESTNTNQKVSVSYRQDWIGMPAQPYLYPALKNNEDQLKRYVKTQLKKEILKVAKK